MEENFKERYKFVRDPRIQIIKENSKLSVDEIKKKVKNKYPYTTNEDMERLISAMNKDRTNKNGYKRMNEER